MLTPSLFYEAKPLRHFIEHLSELRSWLYIAADELSINLDTVCRPSAINSHDVSEEEMQEFETHAEQEGWRPFFCRSQLEEIIENLRQQQSGFTPQQLGAAVDFYWRHDAFIDLSTNAA